MRDWAGDALLGGTRLVTCLIADNLNDLHPLLVNDPRAAHLTLPLPTPPTSAPPSTSSPRPPHLARRVLRRPVNRSPTPSPAPRSARSKTSSSSRSIAANPSAQPISSASRRTSWNGRLGDSSSSSNPAHTLDDFHATDALKNSLREDLALWRAGDLVAAPMGYLICGPVGTGKTYLVECLAGEAGIPVVKIKNFRDKWVGSTEGNLEKIFRLLHGLNRCYVFIDEADQALGRRDAGGNDGGLGGRVYSMFAKEMSEPTNRGRIVWVLASSRPDLIEVDLKRPGRVDVKLPLFPTSTPEESFALLRNLCLRRGIELTDDDLAANHDRLPTLLTPGAAETLALRLYRTIKTRHIPASEALTTALADYQNPISPEIMRFQIGLAVAEASDRAFVPAVFSALAQET